MMKEEFEKFVGETVSNEDYNVIYGSRGSSSCTQPGFAA